MRGSLITDSPIRIVLLVAVILCIVLLVFSSILPAKGNISDMQYITQLCRDWEQKSCDYGVASTLYITVEGESESLAKLCARHYGSTSFDIDTWNKCKGFCMACPKTTTV